MLPINQFGYVRVETSGGETGAAVFRAPDIFSESDTLSLKTKTPLPTGQKRVDRARRRYYWGWGGTWITGAAAWVISGLFTAYSNAYQSPDNTNPSMEMYDKVSTLYYINIGGIALVSVAVAHEIFQMARYIYTSGQDAAPIRR
jgi:hypothetical protein